MKMELKAAKVVARLNGMGLEADVKLVTKNGIPMWGVMMGSGKVKPTMYITEDMMDMDTKDIAQQFYDVYSRGKGDTEKVRASVDDLYSYENMKGKIVPCLMKPESDYVTREFLDLKIYYRVILDTDGNGTSSFAIKKDMLKLWDVTEETIYEQAMKNSKGTYKAKPMYEIMAEMSGMDEEILKEQLGDNPMYVITNDLKMYGAAGILHSDLLRNLSADIHDDLYIIPSSIHEVIVIPASFADEDYMDSMINDVNASEVAPTERLSDHVYKYKEGWEY